MRVLLDECLPRKLKQDIPGHAVKTVPEMGWRGLKNGELIRRAEDSFDIFVTIDQCLRYQQNLQKSKMGIIIFLAANNRIETLRPMMPKVVAVLRAIRSGEIIRVEE